MPQACSGEWAPPRAHHHPLSTAPQANQILGLAPGEIFVQRNVGNQALHTDMNLMSCLEYAVKALKVGGGCEGTVGRVGREGGRQVRMLSSNTLAG
jgi:hypothetical protein